AAAKEDLALVFGIYDRTQGVGHAVAGDDVARDGGGALEVVGCAGRHLVHEDFFGDAATEQYGDGVEQTLFVHAVAVAFGQLHGDHQRPAARDDGDLVDRVGLGQQTRHEGMAGLVVGRVAALFFGHDDGAALGAHDDLVFGLFEVAHVDRAAIAARGKQGGLVDQVGQVGARKTGRAACQHHGVDVGCQRHLAHVHLEDLLAAADVGQRNHHLAVEAARTQQRRIEHVGTVGGGDNQHALPGFKAVHLDQQLVQGLLALVVAAAQACTALAADRIDFVDEDDARGLLLGVFEHVTHARGTDADEHLDEVG